MSDGVGRRSCLPIPRCCTTGAVWAGAVHGSSSLELSLSSSSSSAASPTLVGGRWGGGGGGVNDPRVLSDSCASPKTVPPNGRDGGRKMKKNQTHACMASCFPMLLPNCLGAATTGAGAGDDGARSVFPRPTGAGAAGAGRASCFPREADEGAGAEAGGGTSARSSSSSSSSSSLLPLLLSSLEPSSSSSLSSRCGSGLAI